MPERPDLEYVVPRLRERLVGQEIVDAVSRKPVVLRCALADVRGPILDVRRRAHAVSMRLGERELLVLPMLAGRFELAPAEKRDPADTAVRFVLGNGEVLRYRDDVQMGKVWLIEPGAAVLGLAEGGIDVLGPKFTVAALTALAKGRREQLKGFLMDKTLLDGFGNAYADEALWAAQLHPKRTTGKLSPEELARLHGAMVTTLREACDTIVARQPALPEKLRDFLKVRGRANEPCARCGTTLRTVGLHGHDAYHCPRCQPDSEARGFVKW